MEAFDVLGDPVRRRILELLADRERPAGEVAAVVGDEFGISQPAVSQHLRVLREHGFATVRAAGARRLYAVDPAPLEQVEEWLTLLRRAWEQRLDALGTELAHGAAGPTAGRPITCTTTHPNEEDEMKDLIDELTRMSRTVGTAALPGVDPGELERDPKIRDAMTASSKAWGDAHRASGTDADVAARNVAATTAFYVPPLT